MQRKNQLFFMWKILAFLWTALTITTTYASTPVWTFEPLTPTSITVPANSSAIVQYRVTNQSKKVHTLIMLPIPGITQITTGVNVCSNSFVLRSKDSCLLSLLILGNQLNNPIADGPIVCQRGNLNQCYRPAASHILHINQALPITGALISITGSPLTLTLNGPTGQLTINNTSTEVAATNITSYFTGTALDGKVTETGNNCAYVPPGDSCTLTYTPGSMIVPQTNFTIQGSNTNALTAAMAIQSGSTLTSITPNSGTASGGTGFILTGTGLTGATSITFDGIAATNVNVVDSTTVTGVTPAHAVGSVDVVINTPAGGATLTAGYTYVATAVGQSSSGGTIACLNGGMNNLIAATADNSLSIMWGGNGTTIGPAARSNSDGASNTAAIVTTLTSAGISVNSYAAGLCSIYEVDSQGNTPCQPGNACYNDWFLPAGNNVSLSGQLSCLFTNRAAIGGFSNVAYWSSTEFSSALAWVKNFANGSELVGGKGGTTLPVRCVRTFSP